MELTRFAVIAQTAIVVKAIGSVGIFLYLCQQDALADGVNGAGWNKENIAFFYWCMVADFGNSAILQAVSQFLTSDFLFYTVEQLSTRLGVNNIPHFGFAQLPFVFQGIGIIWMNLYGQIVFGINELNHNREVLAVLAFGPQ